MFIKKSAAPASLWAAVAVILLLAFTGPVAQGGTINFVTNGDFETLASGNTLGTAGGYFCKSGATCVSNVANWTSVCHGTNACGAGGTPDSLLFANTGGSAFNGNIGLWGQGTDGVTTNSPVPNSPTGGNFVAFDGDPLYNASISQTISGLTPGMSYYLTFYQGAAQQKGSNGATTEQWKVTFAGQTQSSALMNNVTHGWVAWSQQVMTFVVPTTSTGTEVLTFLSQGGPSPLPPVVLLDGVGLTETPEPATYGLVGMALIAVPVISRWRQRRRR